MFSTTFCPSCLSDEYSETKTILPPKQSRYLKINVATARKLLNRHYFFTHFSGSFRNKIQSVDNVENIEHFRHTRNISVSDGCDENMFSQLFFTIFPYSTYTNMIIIISIIEYVYSLTIPEAFFIISMKLNEKLFTNESRSNCSKYVIINRSLLQPINNLIRSTITPTFKFV